MNTFTYRGELYIRTVPGKNLFKSTMVHEVVNRGDIFAVRVSDQMLTIIPGNAQVEHSEHKIEPKIAIDVQAYRQKLRDIVRDARAALGE